MLPTTERLADFIAGLEPSSLPAGTRHTARRCILDALGCAGMGWRHPAVAQASRWATAMFAGAGNVPVWHSPLRTGPVAAAFVNSFATSIFDLDDGHRAAAGHPGAAIVPAVLAEAAVRDASLEEIELALVCGYEVGVGIAQSRRPECTNVVATGRWSAVGVAAAVGKLRGLSADRIADAIAIAEAHAPNLIAADHAGFQGGDIKEGIPWSVVTGMAAVEMAEKGLRGYRRGLDNPALYRPAHVLADPGDPFLIETTYFKLYGCCRWIHSAIDAVLDLTQTQAPDRIEAISIATFRRAATLANPVQPVDMIAAQFSVPFAVALACRRGAGAFAPIRDGSLDDPEVIELARQVRIEVDDDLERRFPAHVPARVTVQTSAGRFEREIHNPKGDPANPLSDAELVEKAVRLLEGVAPGDAARAAATALLSDDAPSLPPILKLATTPARLREPALIS